MEDSRYNELHNILKNTTSNKLICAVPGDQKAFNAQAVSNSKEKFRVIQNRKGHHNKNNLTYVLFHGTSELMIRIDLNGQDHNGLKTPHVHIFDEDHQNGHKAIPLSDIENYNGTEEIITSLSEFLKYNTFDISNNNITTSLV